MCAPPSKPPMPTAPRARSKAADGACRSTRHSRRARRRNGPAVRLGDVARLEDGVENNRTLGLLNGQPAIIVLVTRQPQANIIEMVDAVRALLPDLQAQLPQDITLDVVSDSTRSIRSSLHAIELTLLLSLVLVV